MFVSGNIRARQIHDMKISVVKDVLNNKLMVVGVGG
jgi:hypothetical protein